MSVPTQCTFHPKDGKSMCECISLSSNWYSVSIRQCVCMMQGTCRPKHWCRGVSRIHGATSQPRRGTAQLGQHSYHYGLPRLRPQCEPAKLMAPSTNLIKFVRPWYQTALLCAFKYHHRSQIINCTVESTSKEALKEWGLTKIPRPERELNLSPCLEIAQGWRSPGSSISFRERGSCYSLQPRASAHGGMAPSFSYKENPSVTLSPPPKWKWKLLYSV